MSDPAPTPTTLLDRREYLETALAAGAAVGLAGCSGGGVLGGDEDGATPTGLLSTAVSDQPGDIDDFESCVVTIRGIWVGPQAGDNGEAEADGSGSGSESGGETEDGADSAESETNDSVSGSQPENETDGAGGPPEDGGQGAGNDGGEDGDGDSEGDAEDGGGDDGDGDGNGRTYYEFGEPQEADLVELQGERSQLVGEHELEVGTYQFLQLDVADIRGTLNDGSEASVETPGEAPLRFGESFEVREGYRTTFLADFTPVLRGNGSYVFQPVASETEVSYEEVGGSGDGDEPESGNESVETGQAA